MGCVRLIHVAILVVLPGVGLATPAPDTDNDGVPDVLDTCVFVPNASDCDSDSDGYGNSCDADLDQDFMYSESDFEVFRQNFGQPVPEIDQACDGIVVGMPDFAAFLSALGSAAAPGPSGLSCAGTIPCP